MAGRPDNTFTNISGRAKFERFVTPQVWREEVLPLIRQVLSSPPFHSRAKIGQWVIEAAGDDAHMHDFFTKNWHPAGSETEVDVRAWHISKCKNQELLRKILGIKTEKDVAERREQFLKFLEDPLFKICLKDPDYLNFALQSEARQKELAVLAPAFICCPEERASVSLNTTYYGQFKSKCVLGVLEEFLIRQMTHVRGDLQGPEKIWLSMHAGGAEYWTGGGTKRGVVIVGPTGTAKSTHAYGLAMAKKQNRIHSDDWLIVNIGTGEVISAERSFYMRTPMARFYPEIMEKFLNVQLENVPFAEDTLRILSSKDRASLSEDEKKYVLRDLCGTPAARALVSAAEIFPADKRCSSMRLTDLFIVKRDEHSQSIIRKISSKDMMSLLTSEENVFQYRRNPDRPGEEIFDRKTTEYYLNPYLCRTDFRKGSPGDLDKLRIEAWTFLASLPEVSVYELNVFLPVPVTQRCLRRFLEGDIDEVNFKDGLLEFKSGSQTQKEKI